MPRSVSPALPVARNVGLNLRHLRQQRGHTISLLAHKTEFGGHKVNKVAITDIERGHTLAGSPKNVTVDELFALARALKVRPETLLRSPDCDACRDMPPAGMTCNACGKDRGDLTGLPLLPCPAEEAHEAHTWVAKGGRALECGGVP